MEIPRGRCVFFERNEKRTPAQQPHIICDSGNTASGANISVPKGMRSSSLANLVEWQVNFFRVYTPENLTNGYRQQKKYQILTVSFPKDHFEHVKFPGGISCEASHGTSTYALP